MKNENDEWNVAVFNFAGVLSLLELIFADQVPSKTRKNCYTVDVCYNDRDWPISRGEKPKNGTVCKNVVA